MPGQTASQGYFHTIAHPVCELSVASHLLFARLAQCKCASYQRNKKKIYKFKEFCNSRINYFWISAPFNDICSLHAVSTYAFITRITWTKVARALYAFTIYICSVEELPLFTKASCWWQPATFTHTMHTTRVRQIHNLKLLFWCTIVRDLPCDISKQMV